MNTRVLAIVAVVLLGCPETPAVDGGTGGGRSGGGGGAATGGGGAATGGGAGGLTLDTYCAAAKAATCAKDIRCGAAAPGADCQKLALPSRSSLLNARLDCLPSDLRRNIASGLTLFDAAKAQQCLTAIETTAVCSSIFGNQSPDPSCNSVFTGTVAQGSSCYGFNECAPGLYCSATQSVCPSTCLPRVPAGSVVTNSLACEVGLFGAFRPDAGTVCVAPVAQGQSCASPGGFGGLPCAGATSCQSTDDGGSSCLPLKTTGQACTVFAFVDCAVDHTCATGSDGGTQCVPLRRSGQSCSGNLACQAGLACVNALCGPLVAEGGACTGDLDCVAGRVCKAGSCQPLGGLDAGCNTGTFQGDCAIGLFCNGAARCETLHGPDAGCTGNDCSIEQGLSCNLVTDGGVSRCQAAFCSRP